ncbi:MAG: DUF6098 family protein [Mycobacteriales bacterium]
MDPQLPILHGLDELAELVASGGELCVLRARGPAADTGSRSCDELTGAPLPGLSANPLAVEEWWQNGPPRLGHQLEPADHRQVGRAPSLRPASSCRARCPGLRPRVLEGAAVARGPDNEPLVRCDAPIAWLDEQVVAEASQGAEPQPADWGSLRTTPQPQPGLAPRPLAWPRARPRARAATPAHPRPRTRARAAPARAAPASGSPRQWQPPPVAAPASGSDARQPPPVAPFRNSSQDSHRCLSEDQR